MKPCNNPECLIETTNAKFCSRTCAAIVNNKTPKRKKTERYCRKCGASFGFVTWHEANKLCDDCTQLRLKPTDFSQITKGELRGEGNAVHGGRYPMIRYWSRRAYMESGRPMVCGVCSYSYHVDVCHIKDVRDYSEDTTIAEINDASNLVALCKNHHFEFDHGHLDPIDLDIQHL